MSKEVGDEYSSSLGDLTMNSKPLINMLTILAEESIEHASVIVQSVEKHLDKVQPDIKLPVLYLVDSIIKNVGGAYTQLFSQVIVNMFCKVFKQVDERTRSQMFKLRETWHDVFPSGKLYILDVKVSSIDPAWPILTQPPQSNIHVNPTFFRQNNTASVNQTQVPSCSSAVVPLKLTDEEEMRNAVAQKEQELLLLQKKKIELELEQAKKLLEQTISSDVKLKSDGHTGGSLPSAVVAVPPRSKRLMGATLSSNQTSGSLRINPVSPALLNHARRRDPRLARNITSHIPTLETPVSQIPNADVKPYKVESVNNRFVRLNEGLVEPQKKEEKLNTRLNQNKKDPRLNRNKLADKFSKSGSALSKRSRSPTKNSEHDRFSDKKKKNSSSPEYSRTSSPRANKLPPIPKLKSKNSDCESNESISPNKNKRDRSERNKRSKLNNVSSLEHKRSKSPIENNKKVKLKHLKYEPIDIIPSEPSSPPSTEVIFKELKTSTKERNYIRRNREKSESPEVNLLVTEHSVSEDKSSEPAISSDVNANGVAKKDVDLRLITKCPEISTIARKRLSSDKREDSPVKKSKSEKFDALFGDEDVDLRKLTLVENLTPSPTHVSKDQSDDILILSNIPKELDTSWENFKKTKSPHTTTPNKSNLALVRAKLAEATKSKDALGRPHLFSNSEEDVLEVPVLNSEDTDMRQRPELEQDSIGSTIKTILTQAEENLKNGDMDKQQYNFLLTQVLQLSEAQKLKEAQHKESLELSKKKLNWAQKRLAKQSSETTTISDDDDEVRECHSPLSGESENAYDNAQSTPTSTYGDIDERIVPAIMGVSEGGKRPPLLPRPDIPFSDSDLRMHPHGPYDIPRGVDMRYPGRHPNLRMYGGKMWRGMRPRIEERGVFRPISQRGLLPPPTLNRRMPNPNMRMPHDPPLHHVPYMNKGPYIGMRQMPSPIMPYVPSVSPPPLGSVIATRGFSPIDPQMIDYIDQDTMRTIQIDGTAREIRYYDKTAVIMLSWDDPREISFESGCRRIYFDDEAYVLNLNEDYVNVTVDGLPHNIRFGAPTRELYIDDTWFECFFGGPAVPIMLDNKVKYLKLDGPPPQVSIGKIKRTDLVAGKINLIIDATTMHPVFLDPKLQKFEIENVVHTLRFVDSLQTILINEKPFKVEFGGLPKPLFVNKRKHFIRFSVLPRDIKAGCLFIKNMDGKQPPVNMTVEPEPESLPPVSENIQENTIFQSSDIKETEKVDTGISGGLDILASFLSSSMAPASQFSGYTAVAEVPKSENNFAASTSIPGLEKVETIVPPLLQNVDVNDLFAKLVASGIVSTLPAMPTAPKTEAEESITNQNTTKLSEKTLSKNIASTIKVVDIMKAETLKVRQPGLITLLHTGMQCGGCGARFPPEHTVRYSQHLDWHFRQNRADRHSQRRPNSRRWYYDVSDWIQYQEIEDLEEREKSWFEREQQAAEAARSEEAAAVAAKRETSSVPLKSGAPPEQLRCQLCHDTFHQFYNHDTDEWHLRNAVEHEGNNYHPICLDDYKASLTKEEVKAPEEEKSLIVLDKDNTEDITDDGEETVPVKDDDEDEETVEKEDEKKDLDEESVVEVLSEETENHESVTQEVPDIELLEEDDDVVIKNEPVEQIIVDDADTDEETEMERKQRDEMPIDFANIKIKQEPVDPDDEPIITSEEMTNSQADTTHTAVTSSIDGNVQLEPTQSAPVMPVGGIKINITKTFASQPPKEKDVPQIIPEVLSDEPLPPGEEPEILYKLKSTLEGRSFAIQPPTKRGSELSGLCSIM